MSKKKRYQKSRDAPKTRSDQNVGFLTSSQAWEVLCRDGYKPMSECPEVQMCVGIFADLIASMTIHLMQNTPKGDVRLKNELSRKLDINPHANMTRHTFMWNLVYVLMMHGNQVTVPVYNARTGYLDDLKPIPPSRVSFVPNGESYLANIGGKMYEPEEILHFPLRPDPERPWEGMGIAMSIRDAVKSIRQENATKEAILKAPVPTLIVKVDGLTKEFNSAAGRKKLRDEYIDSTDTGQPWMIPAEAFSVEQVKPLTISDLAIREGLELDKRSVAAAIGVPAFMVGVGEFKRDEYNWFVKTRVMAVARIIEQELTQKLLYSPDLYWRFNNRSLLSYDIAELVEAGAEMVDRMALRRNEWRDWIGLPPDGEMDELLALENYIPADKLGDQKKLKKGGGGGGEKQPADESGGDEI